VSDGDTHAWGIVVGDIARTAMLANVLNSRAGSAVYHTAALALGTASSRVPTHNPLKRRMHRPLLFDPRHWPRETRLLVITIVLSLAVLLMLARFRFPAQQPLALPVQPLQQLAARAAFDDLSASVTRAMAHVRPSLLVIARAPAVEVARSLSIEDVLRQDGAESTTDYVLGLRFRRDLAVVVSAGRPLALRAADTRLLEVRRRDDLRGLTLIRVPPRPDEWRPLDRSTSSGPQYLLVAEAVAGDVAMRPLFGTPAGQVSSPYWDVPVLALGREMQAAPGALVFALDGSFVGAIVRLGAGSGLVPADALLAAAGRVADTPARVPATIGVHLQALDAALAAATGADYGVAVSAVDPDGPAVGRLQPGDVITAVADRSAGTPENALLLIAALEISKPALLQGLRGGRPFTVAVSPRPLDDRARAVATDTLGLSLRASRHGPVVVDVERTSAAGRAGLMPGDVITRIGGTASVAPRKLPAMYAALQPGSHVVLGIERDGAPLIVALTRPAR
jgi:hypothetical protein